MDPPERLLCDALVDRDRELADLSAGLDRLPAEGGLALLVGEAGVGKTRLTRELMAVARASGLAVVAGRAVPGATPVPYRALTEAVLAAFRSGVPTDAPELAAFAGPLRRLVPDPSFGGPSGADESPVLLGEALVRVLRLAAGGTGCLLVLEDLHWADAETLEVLDHLAATLPAEPVHAVATARSEGPIAEVVARLRRDPDVTVVGLTPLDASGVERVVAGCLGTDQPPPDLVRAVASASEGNPFLVEELLAGFAASGVLERQAGRWAVTGPLAASVPFDFAESVRRRLAVLDHAGRAVLRAASLLGRRFEWELLPAVAEVDARAVVDALRIAVHEQLVEVDGENFRFRHALTREAVLADVLPPERRELATRALPAVERAHPGLPGEWCELAADLAADAGERDVAVRHLLTSADRALAGGALVSAERIAERARSLATDTELLDDAETSLLRVLALAGKTERSASLGDALVPRLRDPAAIADVLVLLARSAVTAGDLDRADQLVARAATVGADLADGAARARIDAAAALVALEQGSYEEAGRLAARARADAAGAGRPEVECEALEVLGRTAHYLSPAVVRQRFEEAAEIAERHGLTAWHVRARHELALHSAYVEGDPEPLRAARGLAERSGALVSVAVMDLALAELALGDFDPVGCVEHAERCVEASRRYGLATLPVASLWLAGGHALTGDVDAMEAAAAAALTPDPGDPRILGDLWGRVRAISAMVRDDRAELRAALDTMMVHVRRAPATTSIFPNRILWALVHTVEDDDLGAAARAEVRAATHLQAWPFFLASTEILDAVADGRSGRTGEAAARYDAAMARLDAVPTEGSVHYFELLVAEAAGRDGWGDPERPLRRAEAFFASRGYDRIARRCRRALGDAGRPVPRRGRGDAVVPEHLRALGITSREVDVLELVAEGLTTREVAERLFLSPRTVERHLGNLFDRTGRRSRTELAVLLRGELPG